MTVIKTFILTALGVFGSFIISLLGGWSTAMATLLIFIVTDYILGVSCALIFRNSSKTVDGGISSNAGLKGIFKKLMLLVLVMVGYRLDLTLGVDYIRVAVIVSLIANETISITENIALMGVPLPAVITKAISILQNKAEETGEV